MQISTDQMITARRQERRKPEIAGYNWTVTPPENAESWSWVMVSPDGMLNGTSAVIETPGLS
jgi:hypothetical protein